jgi:toxin ParE1/3/4
MNSIRLSHLAEADLEDVWQWIAQDNRRAADKMVQDIISACRRAAKHPESGSRKPSLTRRPLRFLVVRKVILVVYHPGAKPLEIVRILHTSHDARTILAEEP